MQRAKRREEILHFDALGLDRFQRLMLLLHFPDSVGKSIRVNAGSQSHIPDVAVITPPVMGTPLAIGGHGKEEVVIQGSVLREVFIHALNGHFEADRILIFNLLTDALLHAAHLFGETPADHHAAEFIQHMHRIAGQYRSVEHLEEAGIGTDQPGFQLVAVFVEVDVAIERIRHACSEVDTGDILHKAHGDTAADLSIIILIPMLGVTGANHVNLIDILIETVVTQFKEHLGNEHDSHRQPHSQGQDLDQYIVLNFHLSVIPSIVEYLSFRAKSRNLYSFFNSMAGFVFAAFNVCQRTVAKAMTTDTTAAAAKTQP